MEKLCWIILFFLNAAIPVFGRTYIDYLDASPTHYGFIDSPKTAEKQVQHYWSITAASGCPILIEFSSLCLPKAESQGCSGQFLLIKDVDGDPVLQKYCGRNPPPPILSKANTVVISLEIDSSSDKGCSKRFSLRYKAICRRSRGSSASNIPRGRPMQRIYSGNSPATHTSSINDSPAAAKVNIYGSRGFIKPTIESGLSHRIMYGSRKRLIQQRDASAILPPKKKIKIPGHIRTLLSILCPILGVLFLIILISKVRKSKAFKNFNKKAKDSEIETVSKTIKEDISSNSINAIDRRSGSYMEGYNDLPLTVF